MLGSKLKKWFPSFLNETVGSLDVAVYHSYNQIQPNLNPSTGRRELYLKEGKQCSSITAGQGCTGCQAQYMQAYAEAVPGGPLPLWLGEGAGHNGGGIFNRTNRFLDSFYYLHALGVLAWHGHQVFARQTLVGGNYELLRCSGGQADGGGCDFEPRPDFWVALLWRRLMGPVVLNTSLNASADTVQEFRVHAHCFQDGDGTGAVALAFANADESGHGVLLQLDVDWAGAIRHEYHLTASKSEEMLEAEELSLNGGTPLRVSASGLPALDPRSVRNAAAPLYVAPASLGFVVLPEAKAVGCVSSSNSWEASDAKLV